MRRLARPHAQGVLKVTLTRGVGKGYSTAGCVSPTRILSFSIPGALCALAGGGHYSDPESGASGAQLGLPA